MAGMIWAHFSDKLTWLQFHKHDLILISITIGACIFTSAVWQNIRAVLKRIYKFRRRRTVRKEWQQIDDMDGREFERYCADLLEMYGFDEVSLTKGSGDQGVDILAVRDGVRYAIQCKCYSGDLGNSPVQEVYTGKAVYRCHVAAVMTNSYFTQGAEDAADAAGVLLWDRDRIEEMLEIIDEEN